MAIRGAWLASSPVAYAGAQRWGTGINPVHNVTSPELPRQNLNAQETGPPLPPIPAELTTGGDDFGYCDEDTASSIWGYGFGTGTESRAGLGETENRATTDDFPPHAPPPGPKGTLTGNRIRTLRRGSQVTDASKTGAAMPDAQQGLIGKADGHIDDSVVSDPAQYEMQTSMTQRDKTREGSQRGAGSASDFAAPIKSERPTWGQRRLPVSGGERHYDMSPRGQDLVLRGFRYRTAGVGPDRNSPMPAGMFVTTPVQRKPPNLPNQGPEVMVNDYGYVSEDNQGWYLL